MELKKLYEKQISLTEWFEQIGHARVEEMRIEDNEKRERLRLLHDRIGLPYDQPFQCAATDIANRTPVLAEYLAEHGAELCALRLIPLDPELPKLRMRGMTVAEVVERWFTEQSIDAAKYRADFVPHPADHLWSTIFVVHENGVFGEIIRGSHNQLTQGFHDEGSPIAFSSKNFSDWELSDDREDVRTHLAEIMTLLRVEDASVRNALARDLNATFANERLVGYFETVASNAFGTWFIDYNRLLSDAVYLSPNLVRGEEKETRDSPESEVIRGRSASRGVARGRIRIVTGEDFDAVAMGEGEILVCVMTTPDHLPLMRRAGAIVTDLGGILTHAAITCRELGKPCIVGTRNATSVLKEGDLVEVDADRGIVRKIEHGETVRHPARDGM